MSSFSERHPFLSGLAKRVVSIVVTWNVLLACFFGTLMFFGIIGAIMAIGSTAATAYTPVYGDGFNQLLSVKINGTIMGSKGSEDPFSELFAEEGFAYGYSIKEQLRQAADDSTIEGVILEIDSPGGTIYGANAIADGVKYYREKTSNPVYAHIEGLGASAAYWAAASADKVYADYGSTVGSIGVILGPIEFYDKVVATDGGLLGGGVITQNGIESTYITAGKYKDVGNPYRRLTQQEVSILQQSVNTEYDAFVKFVGERRKIPESTIRDQIGAMAYDSKTAKDLKLADAVGSRQTAYEDLARTVGVQDDYSIVRELNEPSLADALVGAVTRTPKPEAKAPDLCALTKAPLAYHGDISAWCVKE